MVATGRSETQPPPQRMHATPQQTQQLPYTASASTSSSPTKENARTTLYLILAVSFFSLLFILTLSSTTSPPSLLNSRLDPNLFPPVVSKISSDASPPSIAYLISGSKGDVGRVLRLLNATYHPRNRYLIHLDRLASQTERDSLAIKVQSVPVFRAAQNVDVIGNSDFAYRKGSSPIASVLHGASILLRLSNNWNWFINLGPGDYPLLTQDDLLHILSYLPKNMNFVNHTSYIGWKESRRLKPIIVDPGLYLMEKTEMFYATQKRELPKSFRLFSGPSFTVLSRSFIEYSILAADNFPRTLLMYLSNTVSSLANYFPTVLCNSKFYKTIVNHNLVYATYNESSGVKYHQLSSDEFSAMMESGAAFARGFQIDDPSLDRIDLEILERDPGQVVPGGWCLGEKGNTTCAVWGDADILRPGPGAKRLEKLIMGLLSKERFLSNRCVVE